MPTKVKTSGKTRKTKERIVERTFDPHFFRCYTNTAQIQPLTFVFIPMALSTPPVVESTRTLLVFCLWRIGNILDPVGYLVHHHGRQSLLDAAPRPWSVGLLH